MASIASPPRGFSKKAMAKLLRLNELISEHDSRCWEIGDLVTELVHSHRMPLSVIAKLVNYSKPRLSEFSTTARFFSPEQRTANFQDSLMTRRMFVRFPALSLTPMEIRDHISGMHGKRPGEIKAYFARLHASSHAARAGREQVSTHLSGLAGRCFKSDWRDVIPSMPDRSIKIINADPPFGGYSWRLDGGYISSRAESSGLRTDADANSDAEAAEVTLELFKLCLPKLAEGGCMLLWQPGARPDNPAVMEAATNNGWESPLALTWLKSNTGVAAEDCPYAPTTERILVFVPKGTKLVKHEYDLSRSDVLSFPSETIQASRDMRSGKSPPRSVHMFQKPTALMEHLLRKHSHPGELIVDCFGCSGSACVAAENLGRRWVYVERNAENFAWAKSNLMARPREPTALSAFDEGPRSINS
jgi:DNA modification methylase